MSKLESKILKDSLSIHLFLYTHTSCCNHRKASIVEFLCLHVRKFSGICWLQAKWVKFDVSRVIVLTQSKKRTKTWFNPSDACTEGLCNVDGEEKRKKYSTRNFRNLVVCNCMMRVHSVRNGRRALPNNVSNSGHHCNTSMHNLSFTKSHHSNKIPILGESKWIK